MAGAILRNGLIGQRAILEDQLCKDIPLVMADEDGRLFQENPEGTFEYIECPEQGETSCDKDRADFHPRLQWGWQSTFVRAARSLEKGYLLLD